MIDFTKPHKRILVLSDIHSGSLTGLTYKDYLSDSPSFPGLYDYRRKFWDWYETNMAKFKRKKFDLAIINGDCIDGPGTKDSLYHDSTNLGWQRDNAIRVLEEVRAKKMLFTRGTGYHVAHMLEAEDEIASHFNAEIFDEATVNVYDSVIRAKHVGSRGGVPHSGTPKLQAQLWDIIKNHGRDAKIADITIRSHTHEYFMTDNNMGALVVTPSLQLPGYSSYGRKIDGFYNVGYIIIYVWPDKSYHIHHEKFAIKIPSRKEVTL